MKSACEVIYDVKDGRHNAGQSGGDHYPHEHSLTSHSLPRLAWGSMDVALLPHDLPRNSLRNSLNPFSSLPLSEDLKHEISICFADVNLSVLSYKPFVRYANPIPPSLLEVKGFTPRPPLVPADPF